MRTKPNPITISSAPEAAMSHILLEGVTRARDQLLQAVRNGGQTGDVLDLMARQDNVQDLTDALAAWDAAQSPTRLWRCWTMDLDRMAAFYFDQPPPDGNEALAGIVTHDPDGWYWFFVTLPGHAILEDPDGLRYPTTTAASFAATSYLRRRYAR